MVGLDLDLKKLNPFISASCSSDSVTRVNDSTHDFCDLSHVQK